MTEKRVGPPGGMPGWGILLFYRDEKGRVISHTSTIARSRSSVIGEEEVVVQETVVGIRAIVALRDEEETMRTER